MKKLNVKFNSSLSTIPFFVTGCHESVENITSSSHSTQGRNNKLAVDSESYGRELAGQFWEKMHIQS